MTLLASLRSLALALVLLVPAMATAQSWAPTATGTADVLSDVHFVTAGTGFAAGDAGLLLTTTNGGQTWSSRVLNAALDHQGVAFNPAGSIGLILTDAGSVWRTTDTGATWTLLPTGMADGRAAIAWGTDAVVWVAGRDANAAVSTDGGLTWTFRPSGAAQRTESAAAVGASLAWVVGENGEIRHTTNGGLTWVTQPSGTTADLKDIQMLDATTGYIAANNNVVLKTTNGGASWANVATPGVSGNGVHFVSATTGWVVADAGQIWHTTTGGTTWVLQPSGTAQSFNRVHFATPGFGMAVGDAGTAVRFGTAVAGEAGPDAAGALLVAPNPATQARVTFALDRAQPATVAVYDVLGRRVATLADGGLAAGTHTFDVGAALPAGVYTIRATTAEGVSSRRLTVTR